MIDALSKKAATTVASLMIAKGSLIQLRDLDLGMEVNRKKVIVHRLSIQPQLIQRIKELQKEDSKLKAIFNDLDSRPNFWVHADGALLCQGRLCVPNNTELKEQILKEAHHS